jgi:hypothetical protein
MLVAARGHHERHEIKKSAGNKNFTNLTQTPVHPQIAQKIAEYAGEIGSNTRKSVKSAE